MARKRPLRSSRAGRDRLTDELFTAFGAPVTVTIPGKRPVETTAIMLPDDSKARAGTPEILIAARARLYAETGDPLRVWEAFWISCCARQPVPGWVATYLVRVGRRMIDISRQEPTGARLATAVLRALELNGRGLRTPFARRRQLRKQQQHAVDVGALMEKGYTQSRAVGLVAEILATDVRSVERAISKVKKRKSFLEPGGWEVPPGPSSSIRQTKPR